MGRIRKTMQAAREAYEARYDGTRIETTIRHAASSLELVAALYAIEQPHRAIAQVASNSAGMTGMVTTSATIRTKTFPRTMPQTRRPAIAIRARRD